MKCTSDFPEKTTLYNIKGNKYVFRISFMLDCFLFSFPLLIKLLFGSMRSTSWFTCQLSAHVKYPLLYVINTIHTTHIKVTCCKYYCTRLRIVR